MPPSRLKFASKLSEFRGKIQGASVTVTVCEKFRMKRVQETKQQGASRPFVGRQLKLAQNFMDRVLGPIWHTHACSILQLSLKFELDRRRSYCLNL
jgi:hypothetical protein